MAKLPPFYHGTVFPRRHYGATADPDGTDDKEWKRLMFEWYGLLPLDGDKWSTWAYCPHAVGLWKGQRRPAACRENKCKWPIRYPLWDHTRAWRNSDGRVVITAEPYGNPFDSAEDYTRMRSELRAIDAHVVFEGRSPYGASYLLAVLPL